MKKHRDDAAVMRINTDKEKIEKYLNDVKHIENYKDFPSFKKNPFTCLIGDIVNMKWNTVGTLNDFGTTKYVDNDTGEVVEANVSRVFRRKQYVDKTKFVKIYFDQIRQLFALSQTAFKVFFFLVYESKDSFNDGSTYLHMDECLEFCGYAQRNMVYRALTDLINKGFICKSDIPWRYFINPLYAFNGNRMIVFNEYICKDTPDMKSLSKMTDDVKEAEDDFE